MLAVSLPEPFDFALTTERFRVFGQDLANLAVDGALHRFLAGREVRIEPAPGGVRIRPAARELVPHVRRFLGAGFDLEGFGAWSGERDPVLASLARRLQGFRPPLVPEPFETLVTSITAQQISLRAATAVRNRLIVRFGERGEHAYAFPMRERLAAASPEELTGAGLSRRKAECVLALARSGADLDALAGLADDEVKARLCVLPGIGEWTADWFLARHLGRPDAWPIGDLGLRKAVERFYGPVDGRALGRSFSPYSNLAAHYLLTGMRVLGA